MVEKFPMEEEEIFFFILNLKMWGFLTYMPVVVGVWRENKTRSSLFMLGYPETSSPSLADGNI